VTRVKALTEQRKLDGSADRRIFFERIDADGILPSIRNNPSGSAQPGRVENDGVIQAFAPASRRSAGNLAR